MRHAKLAYLMIFALPMVACDNRAISTVGTDLGVEADTRPSGPPSVATPQPVPTSTAPAPAVCKNNGDCTKGLFCKHPEGQCHGKGYCEPLGDCDAAAKRPSPDDDTDPDSSADRVPEYPGPGVCGCDGVSYQGSCLAHAAGVSIHHLGPCEWYDNPPPDTDPACAGVTCAVINDCSTCRAYDTHGGGGAGAGAGSPEPPGGCWAACDELFRITKPEAYCVAGQCLLADADDPTCTYDMDCRFINNCCRCGSEDATFNLAPCTEDCVVSKCTSIGIDPAKFGARCVAGRCRLGLL